MKRIEIFLDPSHQGRGYSGSKRYEDEDGYMTVGSSNECNLPVIYRITVQLTIFPDVYIYGGETEYCKLLSLLNTQETPHKWGTKVQVINDFMWDCLLKGMTRDRLQTIVENARENGIEYGIDQAQYAMQKALGLR